METDHSGSPARPVLDADQQRLVFFIAGRRVAETVCKQSTQPIRTILSEMADVPVYGAFVSLKRAGRLRSCCGYLARSLGLAEAVENAAVRAARDDPRFPSITPDELAELDMEVWLLWGLAPVAARGEERIGAITIGRHGLQIARGTARGLLLPGVAVDHGLDAKAFLEQVCLKAGLPIDAWRRDDTTLMTFEGYAIRGPLVEGRVETIERREHADIRPPRVAGTFYPPTKDEIDRALDAMLPAEPKPERWAAAMVPHAGWKYSGRLAAEVFSRLEIPEQVIILCPKHRSGGAAWSVAPYAGWQFPGGKVDADAALAQRLVEGIEGLRFDAVPHRDEHAIEVQLPILARLAPHARVVGIALGGGELPSLVRFGEQLADVIAAMDRPPLLVISGDMNHFADEEKTWELDTLALDGIASFDPEWLYRTVRENHITMCGMTPAVAVMAALRRLGRLNRYELVDRTTSAEVTGDRQSVVGYAGVLLGAANEPTR